MGDDVIIAPAFFFLVGFIVWISVTSWQRRQRLRMITDFHGRLVERLGSVKDFSEFLQTDVGTQFMSSLASETPSTGPQERILRAAQAGIVLTSVGVGLLILARVVESRVDGIGFLAFGGILLSLGIGFLLSSAASYRLASMLGVLRSTNARAPLDPLR